MQLRRRLGQWIRRTFGSLIPSNTWWPIVREPFTGAWQRNREWTADTVLAHHAVFACVTLISSDMGKLRPKLMSQDANGIWTETSSPAFSKILRRPNHFQNRIQFIEWWATSKLIRGNTYALKKRDGRGVVEAVYLLDPSRVKVLVAPDGAVFYDVAADNLSGVGDSVQVPASEIIHDRVNCLFHPLVGISPIFASGVAANMGLAIERNASDFFRQGSNPSGLLTSPSVISNDDAEEMADRWNSEFSGRNSGRIAVLGFGLKFESLRMSAVDSQMIEHLKWTAETVCSAFHVPPFKVGIGQMPTYQNGQTLNQIYYSDCLQSHIEQFELAMDEGLGLTTPKAGKVYGVELDIDDLLRMDTDTQTRALTEGIKGALLTPNEARAKIGQPPLAGGDTAYMQQQNYSLAALDERDRSSPLAAPGPAAKASPAERAARWRRRTAEELETLVEIELLEAA